MKAQVELYQWYKKENGGGLAYLKFVALKEGRRLRETRMADRGGRDVMPNACFFAGRRDKLAPGGQNHRHGCLCGLGGPSLSETAKSERARERDKQSREQEKIEKFESALVGQNKGRTATRLALPRLRS
jgi:hypothetical protein